MGYVTGMLAAAVLASPLPQKGEFREDVKLNDLGKRKLTRSAVRSFGWKWPPPRINLDEESFVVGVPDTYGPNEPHGVFVYISPGDRGFMLSRRLRMDDLKNLLKTKRLIFVGANRSGNKRPLLERLQLAFTGAQGILENYQVDEDRVVVGGFSGGAKMACISARCAPDLFTGVVAIGGASIHQLVQADTRRTYYPADMRLSNRQARLVQNRVAFTFITGPNDFNYKPCLRIEAAYRKAFRSKLIDVPGLAHEIPGVDAIDEALQFVFSR